MKTKFPRADALAVAKELNVAFKDHAERLIFAGSLRRRKPEVGDIEVLFIPKVSLVPDPSDFLGATILQDDTEALLNRLLGAGVISRRLNVKGRPAWGADIKLATHAASGIPIDFFTATTENWFNYLVCRTGGMTSNIQIAEAAQAKGWKWNPFGPGFSRKTACRPGWVDVARMNSERAVFEFAGLPFLEPWERK